MIGSGLLSLKLHEWIVESVTFSFAAKDKLAPIKSFAEIPYFVEVIPSVSTLCGRMNDLAYTVSLSTSGE